MPNKILFHIGDLHSKWESYYSYGFSNFLKWLDTTLPNDYRDNTEIFLAGDVLDKVSGDYSQVGPILDLIQLLKKKASNIYTILGNHDWGIKGFKTISNKLFLEKLGIKVVSDIRQYTTELGFNVLCIPWVPTLSLPEVNKLVNEKFNSQPYDSVVAHWEIQPLFSNDFLDISKLDTKCRAVGHLHTKSNHDYYIGSVLPNSSAENKYVEDRSVIRALIKSEDGRSVVKDIIIPNFVTIKYVRLYEFKDLYNLQSIEGLYYKLAYNLDQFNRNQILDYTRDNNINVYRVVSLKETPNSNEQEVVSITQMDLCTDKKTILDKCKDLLNITSEEYEVMLKRINQT